MTSLFQTRQFHIDAAPDHADVLRAIHDRALDLVIIEGVFSPHHCQLVATQLDAQPSRFPFTLQETLNAEQTQFRLIGESLTPYAGHPEGPELSHYFRTAAEFRGHCRSLFGSATDFEATVEAAFASTGGGRAVELPAGPEAGTTYTPATLRELRPSCEIPLHVGDYFFSTPGYEHLGKSVVLHDQLSYFVPLQNAEQGGELVVYRAEWGKDEAPEMVREKRANWDDLDASWESERFTPPVGALLVFNGGRFYHRVSRVRGTRARWTIGGFLAFAPDDRTIRYWS